MTILFVFDSVFQLSQETEVFLRKSCFFSNAFTEIRFEHLNYIIWRDRFLDLTPTDVMFFTFEVGCYVSFKYHLIYNDVKA